MAVQKISRRIVITCPKRLSPYLAQEVRDLGFTPQQVFSTGVELVGTLQDCIRLNLNLRCASQVLFSLMEFKCAHPDELYRKLITYRWEDILPVDGYFSVTNHTEHFTVNNELFVNVKIKDAIVDRFRREVGRRPDSGSELSSAVVHLHWREDKAEIFLDTSGETLAKHGYRKIPGRAPMLEALAAGTLLAGKWDPSKAFVNPMCGSGTLAIEAAMMATNRRPGLYRNNYAFMHIIGYEASSYQQEKTKLESQIKTTIDAPIIATDNREDAINISKINAQAAGVESLIEFNVCDFAETQLPSTPGVIYFNPEYGERMGDSLELEGTYGRIGDFLKQKCAGYTGYIFTGNLDLAKKVGLRASRRIEFYSAKLDCRLLEYELYSGTKRKEATPSEA